MRNRQPVRNQNRECYHELNYHATTPGCGERFPVYVGNAPAAGGKLRAAPGARHRSLGTMWGHPLTPIRLVSNRTQVPRPFPLFRIKGKK